MLHPGQREGLCDKHPGAEPLPGYRLLKALGRGGFGEVWMCEAPGGLHKAIKFVAAGGDQFRQELAAFEQVRAIRHPYLLTLERVELVGEELVMVMELADGQIHDRFRVCRAEGRSGIPRDELLGYLEEAAEALDMMSRKHDLQHLDVKPDNLFLVAGHVKVGDYGLVRRHRSGNADNGRHGFTPRYTAPEILTGRVDTRSDQYSLALVYAELLTGSFPFTGTTANQLMVQHLGTDPDLSSLPPGDRPAVRRALSKNPADRFPSCLAFVRELASVLDNPDNHPVVNPDAGTRHDDTPDPAATVPNRLPNPAGRGPMPNAAVPTPPAGHRPARNGSGSAEIRRRQPVPPPEPQPQPQIVAVDRLHGMPAHAAMRVEMSPAEFVAAVFDSADAQAAECAHDPLPEDARACRFLSTLPVALIPFKLLVVAESWGLSVDHRQPGRVVMRWQAPPEVPKSAKSPPRPRGGYEVVINHPVPPEVAYTAVATVFGPPDDEVNRKARADIGPVLEQVRGQLQNLDERRTHARIPAASRLLVYPQYSDGEIGTPLAGQCRDVSLGGLQFTTQSEVRTNNIYIEFKNVPAVAGMAVFVRVLRSGRDPDGQGYVTAGRFPVGR